MNNEQEAQHTVGGIKQLLEQQKEFSSKTFGDRPFTAPLHHLLKEVKEVLDESESGAALTEFADCLLLLLDAYWRRFPYWNTDQLISAAFAKQEINKKRKWKAAENGTFQHVDESAAGSQVSAEVKEVRGEGWVSVDRKRLEGLLNYARELTKKLEFNVELAGQANHLNYLIDQIEP